MNIPRCANCASTVQIRAVVVSVILFFGLLFGIAVLGAANVAAMWIVASAIWVGAIVGAIVLGIRITRDAGYQRAGPYPEVTRLIQSGWKKGSAPSPAQSGYGVMKTCSNCGSVVSVASHAGERCPKCGAYWSSEQQLRR